MDRLVFSDRKVDVFALQYERTEWCYLAADAFVLPFAYRLFPTNNEMAEWLSVASDCWRSKRKDGVYNIMGQWQKAVQKRDDTLEILTLKFY